jgi:hypothetical protein
VSHNGATEERADEGDAVTTRDYFVTIGGGGVVGGAAAAGEITN